MKRYLLALLLCPMLSIAVPQPEEEPLGDDIPASALNATEQAKEEEMKLNAEQFKKQSAQLRKSMDKKNRKIMCLKMFLFPCCIPCFLADHI